jgi:hypothetical protein
MFRPRTFVLSFKSRAHVIGLLVLYSTVLFTLRLPSLLQFKRRQSSSINPISQLSSFKPSLLTPLKNSGDLTFTNMNFLNPSVNCILLPQRLPPPVSTEHHTTLREAGGVNIPDITCGWDAI